jgi:hypothetical protein
MTDEYQVCVFGDQTIDWALEPLDQEELRYAHERLHVRVRLRWQRGGIFLLKTMMEKAMPGVVVEKHYEIPAKDDLVSRNQSYAVLAQRARDKNELKKSGEDQNKVFRVERYMGFRQGINTPEEMSMHSGHKPRVIVIDDAALGYRDKGNNHIAEILPEKAPEPQPWVLLKMSDKAVDGDLWEWIAEALKKRAWLRESLIVQVSAARLRERLAGISRDLSWERSVNEVWKEIKDGAPPLSDLSYCRFLVVFFGPTGALLVDQERNKPTLLYDAKEVEGDWAEKHKRLGMMFGYGSSLCTFITKSLVAVEPSSRDEAHNKLVKGIKDGLAAMQLLYKEGFDLSKEEDHFGIPDKICEPENEELETLYEKVKGSDVTVDKTYPPIMPDPGEDILGIAKKGLRGLTKSGPVGEFGNLVTVDRVEIEGLRAIRNLVGNYCNRINPDTKPLAIAVFGGPGSGKNYAITELVKPWEEDGRITPVDSFNLSQFSTSSDLIGALHSIRDAGLNEAIPLAFWDEFDTPLEGDDLGWLRYFLAPIQDGKFQQGDHVHLVGPSIFVFAGGTSHDFKTFEERANGDSSGNTKAIDFVSRLQGYIDIPDVNEPGWKPADTGRPRSRIDRARRRARIHWMNESERHRLMLRRALILNSLFKKHKVAKNKDGSFDVDDAVLNAFLGVPGYQHGVRSMEAIIKMSLSGNGEPLQRWAIPTEEQLNVHVEGKEFLSRLH